MNIMQARHLCKDLKFHGKRSGPREWTESIIVAIPKPKNLHTASIVQGSGIGPASYVVNASDLRAVTPGNELLKFADDMSYLQLMPVAGRQNLTIFMSGLKPTISRPASTSMLRLFLLIINGGGNKLYSPLHHQISIES